jgi:predicted MFS family arabinose efflux permease
MPVSFALISDIVPVEQRQRAIGSFMGVSTLGQALSMGIGGSIAYFFDWRGVFVIYGIIAVIIAVLLWLRLPAAAKDEEIADSDTPMFKPYLSLLGASASRRTYLIIYFEGIFLLGSFSYFGAMLSARFSLSFLAIGGVMTAFGIAALIGGRVSSKLTNRMGRKATVALGLFLMALANGLIWTDFLNPVLATVAVAILGFGFMTTHSNLITMATGFNPKARGAAMSLAPFSFMLGGAIGTQLAAPLITAASYMVMYVVFGLGLLVLGLITTRILPDIDLGE